MNKNFKMSENKTPFHSRDAEDPVHDGSNRQNSLQEECESLREHSLFHTNHLSWAIFLMRGIKYS